MGIELQGGRRRHPDRQTPDTAIITSNSRLTPPLTTEARAAAGKTLG